MHQRLSWRLPACALLLAAAVQAPAETIVLRNGSRLRADRLEREAGRLRLLTANGGWIALPDALVLRIEPDSVVPARNAEFSQPRSVPPTAAEDGALIAQVAEESGVPAELVRAVIWAESGFRRDAVSPQGAIGLMQLMPGTAAELGVDPEVPAENLRGGTRYLRQLLDRFAANEDQLVRALAAYNAGPGRVDAHRGPPPFPETVNYVRRVVRRYLALSSSSREVPPTSQRDTSPPRPSQGARELRPPRPVPPPTRADR